jgi:small subunit ribosomal protein S20
MNQSERRRLRNRSVRSTVRTAVKSARALLDARASDAESTVRAALRTLDKAVTKGVIHGNTAARKKSALARKLAAARPAASSG